MIVNKLLDKICQRMEADSTQLRGLWTKHGDMCIN